MSDSSDYKESCQALLFQIRLLNQVHSLWEQIGEKVERSTRLLQLQNAELENISTALTDLTSYLVDFEDAMERVSKAVRTLEPVGNGLLQKEEEN